MSATSAPANAGLAATRTPSRRGEGDGVAHEPRSRGGGGPCGDLAPERGTGCEERPGADLAHVGRDGVADVLGDGRPVEGDDDVGSRLNERTGVRPGGGERVDDCAELPREPRCGAEQLTRDLGPPGLGEHAHDTPGRRRSCSVVASVSTGDSILVVWSWRP